MSHFTEVQVKFKNKERLVEALIAVGVPREHIEIHDKAVGIFTWNGLPSKALKSDSRFESGDSAHVVIRHKNILGPVNDMGFWVPDEDSEYESHCSIDYSEKYTGAWLGKLKQSYAVAETVAYHEEQGDVVEVVKDAGNVYVYASA